MMGPMLGAAMPDQLMRHMEGRGAGQDAGFFTEGPIGMPGGPDWAGEFQARPHGPRGPMMMQRPHGPDWAQEFGGPMVGGASSSGSQVLEAAFRMSGQAPGGQATMPGPMGAMHGPMGGYPMMGPMMGGLRPGMMGPMGGMNAGPMMGMPAPSLPMSSTQVPVQANQNSEMEAAFAEATKDALKLDEPTDQADLGQAAQMVEMLRNSGNPKFANSQFVSFIDKVSKGDLQFKENTVIDRSGNEVDWDSLYDTAAATASDQDQRELNSLWHASSSSGAHPLEARGDMMRDPELEAAWKAAAASLPSSELDSIWNRGGVNAMDDMWNMAGQDAEAAMLEQAWLGKDNNVMEQIWRGGQKNDDYQFQKDNPYADHPDPLAEAQRLIAEGRDREAMLALEAEVTRNPDSSEGWRQLGQLYAEMDQDVEAIQCLRKGHEVDPYNLESLLALGVSCTNELDQLPALRYLRMWIENHEEHSVLVQGLEMPAEYEYEAWRQQVTAIYKEAAAANPLDANVFVALGVMENINRNYEGAVLALATACRLRPDDHTSWNKLGATLANSGKSEQAVVAYHQGLQLKPNYARSWSNLAIAHANLGQHADAARFYLSSLVLNPEATHIWNFLHSAVLNMDTNVNAYEAIDQRDLSAATKIIDGVLDPEQLPKPKKVLDQNPDEILASIGL